MPRGKKSSSTNGEGHHGLLAAVEAQYLAALKFSREQIDKRIRAIEETMGTSAPKPKATKTVTSGAAKSSGKKKPRDYDMLKAKVTKPMTMEQLVKAIGKQEGTVRQVMTNYPGLFESDGKRPATYTFDTSR